MWRRKPSHRILVVEWPCWDDDEECEGCACETDVEAVVDVLGVVTGNKGKHLNSVLEIPIALLLIGIETYANGGEEHSVEELSETLSVKVLC